MMPLAVTYPDLAGKVAFVTAGSSAIGSTTCRLLAANGVRVGVSGRNETKIAEVVHAIREAGGEAVGSPADCTKADALDDARERIARELGPVEILVAFAGGGSPTPFLALTEETWRAVVDDNLTATFLTIKAFVSSMIARRRGTIITMASSAGRLPGLASPAYAAAKAGIVMLTAHLAKELTPQGIRANCVAPSAIMNARLESLPEEKLREIAAGFPLGRIGTPEDVALATLYFASEASSWVTGTTLDISGGRVIV
jgi:3-oxoacyl-[acyl-carrier protein] reductase